MISLQVSTFLLILVTMCTCNEHMKKIHEERRKNMEQCITDNGLTSETFWKLKKEYRDNHSKPDDIQKNFTCTLKCIDEKKGNLKDGKFQLDKIQKDVFFFASLKTPDEYLKCLKNIDAVKECEDYKKKMICDHEVGDSYMRECASKLKLDDQSNEDGSRHERSRRRRNHKCMEKCILESKGVIGKDGKIIIKEAEKDAWMMWMVNKDKEAFLNCIKDLVIKECEDMSKIWSCKKQRE